MVEKLQTKLLKWGMKKSIVILTLLSIITSVLLTGTIMTLLWNDEPRFREFLQAALLTATVVPAMIAPIISTFILKLFFKVHALERETRFLATYDALTGLLSRRAFYENAEEQLKITVRNKQILSVMVADLDGFKLVNDRHGHNAGDQVLKKVGEIITENAREDDLVGRVGGDEFVFCLCGASGEYAKEFGQRLQQKINQSVDDGDFNHNGQKVEFGISIGIHIKAVQDGELLSDLIHEADLALYQAKNDGKGCLKVIACS